MLVNFDSIELLFHSMLLSKNYIIRRRLLAGCCKEPLRKLDQVRVGNIPAVQMQKLSASEGCASENAAPLPALAIFRFVALNVGVTVTVTASAAMVLFGLFTEPCASPALTVAAAVAVTVCPAVFSLTAWV